jgi:hypothetical protein
MMYNIDGVYPQQYLPRYLVGVTHKNTDLINIDAKSNEKSTKLAFIFYFYQGMPYMTSGGVLGLKSFFYASPFPITTGNRRLPVVIEREGSSGGEKYQIALTARSLYENFWKEWDAVLRHSGQEYEAEFNLSKAECAQLDMAQKVMVNNQPYLVSSLEYSFGKGKMPKLTLRSLRLRQPYDLDADGYYPPLGQKTYAWVFFEDLREVAYGFIYGPYGLNASAEQFVSYQLDSFETDPDQAPGDISDIDPPTENEYNMRKKILVVDYTGILYYTKFTTIYWNGINIVTGTSSHRTNIPYQCYYYPDLN